MFPLEIWGIIAQHIDAPTILILRATSKGLQYICETPFELTWVRERVYDITLTGLQKLQRDTEHPKFARGIQTVLFDFDDWESDDYGHQRAVLEVAFNNLIQFGKPISLGLRRSNDDHLVGSYTAQRRTRGMLHRVVSIADKAKLEFKSLILDLRVDDAIPDFKHYFDLLGSRPSWVPDCTKNANSMVRMWTSSEEPSFKPIFHWLRALDEFEIIGMVKEQLQKALGWMVTIRPCSLSIRDSQVYSTTLQDVIGSTRKQVRMSNVTIHEHDNISWASIIFSLRSTTGLALCHLENISNSEGRILVGGGDKRFRADGRAEVAQGLEILAMDASKTGEA